MILNLRSILFLLLILATIGSYAQKPTISYSSPQSYPAGSAIAALTPTSSGVAAPGYSGSPVGLGSGFNAPYGVAVDAAGNVYVADYGNDAVKMIPVGGGATAMIGSGFSNPAGVAVDAAGNVYVADEGNGAVKRIPVGGGAPVTIASGLSGPIGVALDAAGYVYVAAFGNNTVYKVPVTGGSAVAIGSGFNSPTGVAVDASGNIYVADEGNSAIKMIPAGNQTPVIIGSGFTTPFGVTVDDVGNVYVADLGNNEIKMIPAGGGAPVIIGTGFSSPRGVAIDHAGNVNVGDSGNNAVKKISPVGGYYISAALPAGLSFNGATGIISGVPTVLSPAINYTITAYNSSGGTPAVLNIQIIAPPPPAISYSSPQTYLVSITVATLPLSSSRVAPPRYSSNPVALGSGFKSPYGVAVDAAGNIYVADEGNSAIKKVPVGGGTPVTIGSGFDYPTGVAIDAAGNVYVADLLNNAVKEIPVGGGATITIGSGFSLPYGVAVDAAGNVYVADSGNNAVKKIPVGNGTPVAIGSGFTGPTGVAVDVAGNVYVADHGNDVVKKVPVGGGAPVIIGSGFVDLIGVAVDASGDVIVGDFAGNAVKMIPVSGSALVNIGSGFSNPAGVAVDVSGKIYVADVSNNAVKQITPVGGYYLNVSLPAGLSLNDATGAISGIPSAISPAANYKITAYNLGGGTSALLNITVVTPPAPAISYISPPNYVVNTAITVLTPVSSNVSAPGFSSSITSIGSGFNGPEGVAADAAGNVYVADGSNDLLKEIPAGGGATVSLQSFNRPYGVAVDAAGNVYVSELDNKDVMEIPAGSTTPIVLASGFNSPTGVAVDALGNVYVADAANNTVSKIPAGGGTPVTLASGFDSPEGVAADAHGNVYVADGYNKELKEIPVGSGTPVIIGSYSAYPVGVSVDALGNLFVCNVNPSQVVEIPVGGGATIMIGSGFNDPSGVSFDGSGNLYVADLLNNAVKKINPAGGFYISPQLPAGLSMNGATGVISGTPTVTSPATNYTITAYNITGSTSTTVNIRVNLFGISYSSPKTYTQGITVAALTPTVSGNGAVAAPGFSSSIATLGSGFNGTKSVAADAAGNVYVADYVNGAVKKIPAGGGAPVTLASFTDPEGVAVDAAGNVYVAVLESSVIEEIPVGGGTPVALGSGFNTPRGVAVDGAGNVYVAEFGHGQSAVAEIPVGGGAPVALGSGFNGPLGVAVDAQGNVYVADSGNNAIKKVSAGGGAPVIIYTDTSLPVSVSVDALGNVFVCDNNPDRVFEIPVGGGATITIGSGFSYPAGVSFDGPGNLYVADYGNNAVKKMSPVGGFYINPFLPVGLSMNGATGVIDGTPTVTGNATNYTVTAYNAAGGAAATVNIKVTANATLSKLTVSSGTLSPAFAAGTTGYTDKVANTVDSIAVRAITGDPAATEIINGKSVPEGTVSPYFPLNVGLNTITVVVTAQDGVTKDSYTIAVTRVSNIATLLGLTVSSGTLTPAFVSGTTSYTDVAHSVSSIAFRATTTDPLATETINGTAVPEGTVSPYIPLNVGLNNISIIVTAQDGVTKDTYTIAVTRLPEIATLSKLTISSGTLTPAFASGTTSYTDVAHAVSSIAFRATTTDALATETINGTAVPEGTISPYIPLTVGVNNISIVVTAQDGVTQDTYTIAVTRLPEVATLSKLTISSGTLTPAFVTGTTSYTDVAHSVSSIAFRATTTDALATETINGTAVPEGTVSPYIPLNVGSNTITIVVTAQDGVTQDTYTIAVTRLPEIATLSGLTISSGTLSPAFAAATTSYTDNVANTVSSIAFRATTTDALATETINGTTVPEGTVSPYFPLNVGSNTITIIVTAQDGVTTETYSIDVTRAAPAVADAVYQPVSVEITETLQLANDGILVHQGVSPNGDGIDDFLQIDNITNYPDNRLAIMNRNGMLVFETKGYDNASRVFDGHSSKNGKMQLPGTYFYELDYTINGVIKHKAGFLVLKY